MKADNHPWYQVILANAEKDGLTPEAPRFASLGRWAMLTYQITGDPRFAVKSLTQLKGDSSGFTRLLTTDANGIREWFIEYNLIYDWIAPGLPVADREAFAAYLIRVADAVIAGGARFNDSDQMIGVYFGLALVDLNLGTSYLSKSIMDLDRGRVKPVGGLIATGADLSTMRNAIRTYVEMADGGIFIESTEYNQGTLELLYMGAAAVKTATAIDHFPEVTAFSTQHAQAIRHELVPGLKDQNQFGDIEAPHSLLWHHLDGLYPSVAALAPDPGLRSLEADLRTANGVPAIPNATQPLYPRYFYQNSPYLPATDWKSGASLLHVAKGMGQVFARTGWTASDRGLFFWAQNMAHPTTVDHWYAIFGDLRFYRNGKFVIDHPLAYSNPPTNHHMLLVGGGASFERGGLLGEPQFEAGKFLRVTGYNAGASPIPDGITSASRRTVHWLMDSPDDVIVVIDRQTSNGTPKLIWHTVEGRRQLENGPARWVTAFVIGDNATQITTVVEGEAVRVKRPGLPDVLVSLDQPAIPSDTRVPVPAKVSTSSAMPGFDAATIIDGNRIGPYWNDSTSAVFPDWVRLDFATPTAIQEVLVTSVQDSPGSTTPPTPTMDFGVYGLMDFDVQVLEADAWKTVAAIRGNSRVLRAVAFAPVTTSAVRLNILRTGDQWSRLVELQAYGDASTTPAPTPIPTPVPVPVPVPVPTPTPTPTPVPTPPPCVVSDRHVTVGSSGSAAKWLEAIAAQRKDGYELVTALSATRGLFRKGCP